MGEEEPAEWGNLALTGERLSVLFQRDAAVLFLQMLKDCVEKIEVVQRRLLNYVAAPGSRLGRSVRR